MRRALALCALFVGCAFEPVRTAGLGDGEIHAVAVRSDGAPASNALVSLQGSARVTTAGADGSFVLAGLVPGTWFVRITEDDDGDGAPERGAHVPVEIRRAGVPKNLSDGCAGAPKDVVTSVLLGDVLLADAGALVGSVTLDQDGGGALGPDERARVVVWRDLDGYATQIEAAAGVDVNGSYRIEGVLPGPVHVAAFVFDVALGSHAPKLFAVGDVEVAAGEALLNLVVGADAARTVAAQLELQWTLPEPAAVDIVQASFTGAGGAHDLGFDVTPYTVQESVRSLVYDLPVGVVDVLLTSATSGAADGLLRGAVVVPESTAVLGPVELPLLADPCAIDGVRDCDRDGVPGLPLPSSDDDPAWAACKNACQGAFGAGGARALCDTLDCDDDGDGQPDVTEPARCLGPGVGTDLDADDLCEPAEDPFPACATDDRVGCPAPFTPPPSRY